MMENEVLVSVIIPVYNVESYIEKCIKSVVSQTYKNLEVLLIDDGSTDNSGTICDEFANEDNRIIVYHKKNEGLGLTRNFGLKHASGQYVLFIDSDDYIEIESISRLLKESIASNADLVVEGYKKITDQGVLLFEEKYEYEVFEGKAVLTKFLPRMIGSCPEKTDSIFTTVCSKLYKREKIVENGVMFHSERKLQSEDLGFQMELVPHLDKVVVTQYTGYFYRTNLNSLTTVYKPNRFEESKKVFLYIIDKISELDLPKEVRLRADKMLFVQVKAAIRQENPQINHKHLMDCRNAVKEIVSDKLLQDEIISYPIDKLNFKQKMFLYLMKHKFVFILMIGVLAE